MLLFLCGIALDFLSYWRNEATKENGEPLSSTTVKHHFGTLRNILDFGVYLDFIPENVCKKIRKEDKPRKEEKEVDFLEEDEALRFLACLDSEEEKAFWEKYHGSVLYWKTMCNTLILTGLRRGELIGLQWRDYDRKNLCLHVARNVTLNTQNKDSKQPEDKLHIGTTKGKESRTVPITRYLADLLDSFKKEQDKKYGTLMPTAYIFCRTGKPFVPAYPTEPTRQMRKYIKRHNLPNVSPHDLRHTAASLAIEAGADVKQVQNILGHKDPTLTLKFYTGISARRQREATEGIERLLRPETKEEKQSAAFVNA